MAIINVFLVRWANGLIEVQNQPSVDEFGRREGYLALGDIQSEDEARVVCQSVFKEMSAPQISTTLAIEPVGNHDVPYQDFRKGDYINAPAYEGGLDDQRVRALTTSVDDDGRVIFVPELRSVVQEEAERLQRWLKRLANGAVGGATSSSSPVTTGGGVGEFKALKTPPKTGAGAYSYLRLADGYFDLTNSYDEVVPFNATPVGLYQFDQAANLNVGPIVPEFPLYIAPTDDGMYRFNAQIDLHSVGDNPYLGKVFARIVTSNKDQPWNWMSIATARMGLTKASGPTVYTQTLHLHGVYPSGPGQRVFMLIGGEEYSTCYYDQISARIWGYTVEWMGPGEPFSIPGQG